MDREMLEQPFDKKCIKKRRGNFGKMLDYLEAHVVINRLNDAFDSSWSFEIVEHQQMEDEVVVLGKLTAEGITKQQFGNSKITRAKDDNRIVSIGDDLKAAASDCIKKAATLFGVGLHMYGDLDADNADDKAHDRQSGNKKKNDMSNMSGNQSADNLISKEQLASVKGLRTKLGWSPEELQDKAERLFSSRDIATLNRTMGTALIAYLQNQNNGSG